MNAGKDYDKAKVQAQANANRANEARWLHWYGGAWWISKTPTASAEKINPERHHATKKSGGGGGLKHWKMRFTRRGMEPPRPFGKTTVIVCAESREAARELVPASPNYPITSSATTDPVTYPYHCHHKTAAEDQSTTDVPESSAVHHATRKSTKKTPPAQLNREIAEVLARKDKVELAPLRAIQIMETAPNEAVAREIFAGQREQIGYLGGRILPPSPVKPGWRVQVFIEDDGGAGSDWLPHGMRRVIIPAGMRSTLGI